MFQITIHPGRNPDGQKAKRETFPLPRIATLALTKWGNKCSFQNVSIVADFDFITNGL